MKPDKKKTESDSENPSKKTGKNTTIEKGVDDSKRSRKDGENDLPKNKKWDSEEGEDEDMDVDAEDYEERKEASKSKVHKADSEDEE